MLRSALAIALILTLVPACGSSSKSSPPQGGNPVMLAAAICWVDVNNNGTPDVGDHLQVKFDRSVQMGANPPTTDLVVANGSLGTSTWTNGPGFAMTVVLAGAIDLSNFGKVGTPMTIQLAGGNTLSNPVDGSTPATPAAAAQTLSASVVDSGQNLGSATAFAVLLQNVNSNILPDIVLGVNGSNRVYFNDSTGVYTLGLPWIGEPSGGRDTRGVTLLDENGDGKADYCVTGNAGDLTFPGTRANLVYVISDGLEPTFTHTPSYPNTGWTALGNEKTSGIGSADFNGDGNLDVVCVNQDAQDFIYFGNGFGLFNGNNDLPQVPFTPAPHAFGGIADTLCVSVGDIDGVAGDDFVTGGSDASGTFTSWRVNNAGTAISLTILTGIGDVRSIHLCDLDNDGDKDAVVGLAQNGGFKVFENNGSGMFAQVGANFGTNNIYGVTCCDVNGDMFNDVILAGANGQPNTVWLNCGSFTFEDSGIRLGTESSLAIATSDPATFPTGVDATGVNDFAVANGGGPVKLYLTGK